MRGPRILLLGGAALIVGLAAVSILVLDRGKVPVLPSSSDFSIARFAPTLAQRELQRIAVVADEIPECAVPKPPKSLGATALTRNSLQQILRILAPQSWQETGSCGCFYDNLSWDDVILASPNFERTDGVNLHFKMSDLLAQANELEALGLKACPL